MKDDALYLDHILTCLDRVESFIADGEQYFMHDIKTQDAVIRNLQVLSESTQRISPDLKDAHPEIPWARIAAFRNVLTHGYLDVDLEVVWEVIQEDLPALRKAIRNIDKP